MEFNTLVYIAILLAAGLLCGRLVKLIKLPNVTGYLLAGLLLGPYVFKILPENVVSDFSVVSDMALAFIAFTIGLTFKRSYFKRVGMMPVIIAFFEALVAVFLVQFVLIACGFDKAFSIVLGAIAAATAPAATIMVIKQYKAKGPVTETLLSVVAIDDAVALMAFGFSVTIANSMNGNGGSILMSVLQPFIEIGLSVLIGAVVGVFMLIPMKYFKKTSNRLSIAVCAVFLSSGAASMFGASALLTTMVTGMVFCNISNESDTVANIADNVTPPIFMMFFVISGAQLNVSIIPQIGIVGILYLVVRVAGKMLGSYIGAKLTHAPDKVCKYIGPTLIPQAGVAIGLTIVAQTSVPQYADVIRAVILCATLIYEIIGPVITKIALVKAGEIKSDIVGAK
ncbi:MAG: cation:proton antiporter [Ruminococcaceae bacterium]|nr:cation:proton antiporter [Oscillospiraceae bacterium]